MRFCQVFFERKIIIVRKSPTQSVGATVHTPRLSLPLGEGPAAPVHNLTFLPPSVREGDRVSGGRSFFRAKNSPSRHSAEDVFPMGKLRETLCVSYGRPSPRGLKETSPLSSHFRPSFFDMRLPRSRFLPPEMGRLGISRAPPPSVPQIFPAATARMRRLFCPVFPTMQIHKKERKCIS